MKPNFPDLKELTEHVQICEGCKYLWIDRGETVMFCSCYHYNSET